MNYVINSTEEYHRERLETLGWELTVSNALYPTDTPCRKVLRKDASYGDHLYDYLERHIPMAEILKILEIGGGYGYLMKDWLIRNPSFMATMLDISPVLLDKQKETLSGIDVNYIERNFLDYDISFLKDFDLAVMNENLGDFPTHVNLNRTILFCPLENLDFQLKRVRHFFDKYNLDLPVDTSFNFNTGALEALEKLCLSGIPYIFLSEHSCESFAPEPYHRYIKIKPPNNPERISLKGHDEYTIRFSYLQQIAHAFDYRTIRGIFADFIELDFSDRLRVILSSPSPLNDEAEIIRHFTEDLFKYEYLILINTRKAN